MEFTPRHATRAAVALAAIAGLVVAAACADQTTAPSSIKRSAPNLRADVFANAQHVNLCVGAGSPAGTYTFVNINEFASAAHTGYTAGTTSWNVPVSGVPPILPQNPYTISHPVAGTENCLPVLNRTARAVSLSDPTVNDPEDPFSLVTVIGTTNTAGAIWSSVTCLPDAGSFCSSSAISGHPDETVADANFIHGSKMVFNYVAPAQTIPLFVIGDLAPWTLVPDAPGLNCAAKKKGIDNCVNFWGSQWWKNNPMSDFHSNGWPSFKGYASSVDLTAISASAPCGTWISRVGNSPPPPQTIPTLVGIIITNNVVKIGPDEGGNIQRIVIVHSDGGYGPNPGHDGNGPVVQIVCG